MVDRSRVVYFRVLPDPVGYYRFAVVEIFGEGVVAFNVQLVPRLSVEVRGPSCVRQRVRAVFERLHFFIEYRRGLSIRGGG